MQQHPSALVLLFSLYIHTKVYTWTYTVYVHALHATFHSENVPWEEARIANGNRLPFTYRYLRLCVVAKIMAIRSKK